MLDFLYTAVSWVLLRWHDLFTAIGFSDSSGFGWALSIVFLVITARILLFRLFIKQVHYTRNMQKMQPKIQKLREKYKNDRAALNREMMALQQEEGFNPLSGCLPMLLQFPVFIGLYHVLRHSRRPRRPPTRCSHPHNLTLYTFTKSETIMPPAPRSSMRRWPRRSTTRPTSSGHAGRRPDIDADRAPILLVISSAATFGTQLLVRRSATTTPEGTAATVQRLMLYLIPVGTLASGLLFNFPLGVLLYWFTSNLWTLGQQAYIIRFHPATPETVAVPVSSARPSRRGPVNDRCATARPPPAPRRFATAAPTATRRRRRGDRRRCRPGGDTLERAQTGSATEPQRRQASARQTPDPGEETALSAPSAADPVDPRKDQPDRE